MNGMGGMGGAGGGHQHGGGRKPSGKGKKLPTDALAKALRKTKMPAAPAPAPGFSAGAMPMAPGGMHDGM